MGRFHRISLVRVNRADRKSASWVATGPQGELRHQRTRSPTVGHDFSARLPGRCHHGGPDGGPRSFDALELCGSPGLWIDTTSRSSTSRWTRPSAPASPPGAARHRRAGGRRPRQLRGPAGRDMNGDLQVRSSTGPPSGSPEWPVTVRCSPSRTVHQQPQTGHGGPRALGPVQHCMFFLGWMTSTVARRGLPASFGVELAPSPDGRPPETIAAGS